MAGYTPMPVVEPSAQNASAKGTNVHVSLAAVMGVPGLKLVPPSLPAPPS